MDIKVGEVHIWRYTVDEKEYQAEKLFPLLSIPEQERCDRYIYEAEKIRYTGNHRFVRRVLSKYLRIPPSEIIFGLTEKGKPFLRNSNIRFNYSYRTTFGILAISNEREVGVDIERMKPLQDLKTFCDFSFSEKEREIIFSSAAGTLQDTLFTFWTFKEAIIKALGVGLNADLTQIDLSPFIKQEFNHLAYNQLAYTLKQINAEAGYRAAYALEGRVDTCTEFNYTE